MFNDFEVSTNCAKCGQLLTIKEIEVNPLGSVKIIVMCCTNIGCYDCSKCDEKLKLRNNQLVVQVGKLKAKLNKIKSEASR